MMERVIDNQVLWAEWKLHKLFLRYYICQQDLPEQPVADEVGQSVRLRFTSPSWTFIERMPYDTSSSRWSKGFTPHKSHVGSSLGTVRVSSHTLTVNIFPSVSFPTQGWTLPEENYQVLCASPDRLEMLRWLGRIWVMRQPGMRATPSDLQYRAIDAGIRHIRKLLPKENVEHNSLEYVSRNIREVRTPGTPGFISVNSQILTEDPTLGDGVLIDHKIASMLSPKQLERLRLRMKKVLARDQPRRKPYFDD